MNHSFTVNFDMKTIFKSEECEVTQFFVNGDCIGFVAETTNPEKQSAEPVITPFTETALMEDAHCFSCAAEQLFSAYTGIPVKSIGITTNGPGRSPLAALLMAGVLSAAMKGR